jgi:hypothetical protein
MYVGSTRKPQRGECDACLQVREVLEGLGDDMETAGGTASHVATSGHAVGSRWELPCSVATNRTATMDEGGQKPGNRET